MVNVSDFAQPNNTQIIVIIFSFVPLEDERTEREEGLDGDEESQL